jgi:hypothetical protein
MRAILTVLLAAAAIGLGTVPAPAQQPFYGYGGYTSGWGWTYGFNYLPACPLSYHYTCWVDPYGYKHCGCVVNGQW